MKIKKILVITGTRAEYGILRSLLYEIVRNKKLKLILVVTGTHLSKKYGYSISEIIKDGFKINAKFSIISKNDTNYSMSIALGKTIIQLTKIFKKFNPDINLVIGDRNEMLASSLVSSHLNISTVHIHGGDISGGIDEYNRHAITKLSNIHFAATKKSMDRIIRMGENPRYVFNVGALALDEIKRIQIPTRKKLEKKYNFSFNMPVIVLLFHPDTTESEKSGSQIQKILDAIVRLKFTTITIAPNSDVGNNAIFSHLKLYSKKHNFIHTFSNFPRSDYLGLLKYSNLLIGNSSSGIIESSSFNLPVINLGLRQRNREKGSNVIDMENPSTEEIYNEVKKIIYLKKQSPPKNSIYGNGTASKKIIRELINIQINKKLLQKQISY